MNINIKTPNCILWLMLLCLTCIGQGNSELLFSSTPTRDVQLVDFNNDGNIDIFSNGTLISIDFEQEMANSKILEIEDGYYMTVDIDQDGDFDVISTSADKRIYENVDGHFQLELRSSINAIGEIHLADMNADGKLDLIVHNIEKLRIFIQKESFEFELAFEIDQRYLKIQLFDFDGDENTDIIGQLDHGDFQFAILVNTDGTGTTFEEEFLQLENFQIVTFGDPFQFIDFNNDGYCDIVMVNYLDETAELNWFDGFNFFAKRTLKIYNDLKHGHKYDIFLTDVNHDSNLDIIHKDDNNRIEIIFSNEELNFEEYKTQTIPTINEFSAFDLSNLFLDIDNDGVLEMYVPDQSEFLSWNEALAQMTNKAQLSFPNSDSRIFLDFDNDDDLDMLCFGTRGMSLLENIGTDQNVIINHFPKSKINFENSTPYTFSPEIIPLPDKLIFRLKDSTYRLFNIDISEQGFGDEITEIYSSQNNLRIHDYNDVNGDGLDDLIFWDYDNQSYYYHLAFSETQFDEAIEINNCNENDCSSLALHDFDSDGDLDFYYILNNALHVRENDYPFESMSIQISEDDWHDQFLEMIFEDINNDGKTDIVAGDNGSAWLFINEENQMYTQTPKIQRYACMGDINGDGLTDIVQRDSIYFNPNSEDLQSFYDLIGVSYQNDQSNFSIWNTRVLDLNLNGKAEIILTTSLHSFVYWDMGDFVSNSHPLLAPAKDGIKFSPNPAQDFLIIEYDNHNLNNMEACLFDQNGKLLKCQNLKSGDYFELTGIKNGSYFLHCKSTDYSVTKKVVILNN